MVALSVSAGQTAQSSTHKRSRQWFWRNQRRVDDDDDFFSEVGAAHK
jgi:hypothetical protein